MAHRDLNERSIPLTSYPSLASAPPQTAPPQAVYYAQPVAQPMGQPSVPYAQPYVPNAQPYVPSYQPYYAPEYAAQPAAAVPLEPPVPAAQPVPVPQSLRDLKQAVRARAQSGGFHYSRYISDAQRFTCKNFCSLVAIMLLWCVVGWGVSGGLEGIVYGHRTSYDFDWEYPTPKTSGDNYPQEPTNPIPITTPSSSSSSSTGYSATTSDDFDEASWQWWDENLTQTTFSKHVNAQEVSSLVLFGVLHLLAAAFIWVPAIGGLFVAVFNAIRNNNRIKFRDYFSCFRCSYYCKLVKLALVLSIAKAFLTLLFILPGIWWSLATLFAIPLHKEYPFLGVRGAIRISKMVVHRYFCQMLCFLILLALLQVAGFLCLLVGLFYTLPIGFTALCFCFDDLIGLSPAVVLSEEPMTVHV